MLKSWEAGLVCAWFVLAGVLCAHIASVRWVPQILLASGSFLALALCRTPPRG